MNVGLRENLLSKVKSVQGVLEETAAVGKDANLEEQNKVKGSPHQTPSEPPVDWFEPLEDEEDAQSSDLAAGILYLNGERDAEEESLAGESERSGSVAGSERNVKRKSNTFGFHPRKRSHVDEGWEPWPILGSGWMRKEVVRRSGNSVGQKDVYYLSPKGERFRSRVELSLALDGILDMTAFEFKSGRFIDGNLPPVHRGRKRKIRESSSPIDLSLLSESSLMDGRERADTPDHQRSPHSRTSLDRLGDDDSRDKANKLPRGTKSTKFSTNGLSASEDSSLTCAKCGDSFIGTTYDKQRKKPWCPKCWTQKPKEHPDNRRKLRPCGECMPCHIKWDCGQCVSCINGQRNLARKPVRCRKRKCLRPKRKDSIPQTKSLQTYDTIIKFQSEPLESQKSSSYQNSDTEDLSVNVYVEDDEEEGSTDDDDDWHKKRKRRACGKCKACLRKDCGSCDFCADKPKFGGSNKKRQKCRLRQCQRQAMLGQAELGTQDNWHYGRPRPANTYSRKMNSTRIQALPDDLEFSDEQDDRHSRASVHRDRSTLSPTDGRPSGWERAASSRDKDLANHLAEPTEELPMITQIFSLAENPAAGGVGMDDQLLKLLGLLRNSALPILWYAIMVEGPRLQLLQCSKQSCMTDTIVNIDPGFSYQITVQGQPLLFTHVLYETHPSRLASVTDVVSLLLDLEKCKVCQGLPFSETLHIQEPVIFERASTCDFLVKKDVQSCSNCRALYCG